MNCKLVAVVFLVVFVASMVYADKVMSSSIGTTIVARPVKTETVQSSRVVKAEVDEIKTSLRIPADIEINNKTVERLAKVRKDDPESFKEITNITRVIADSNDKETMANELAQMNPVFVRKFSRSRVVRKQVQDYVSFVKNSENLKARVQERQIEKLFSKEMDIDKLIEEIWNN